MSDIIYPKNKKVKNFKLKQFDWHVCGYINAAAMCEVTVYLSLIDNELTMCDPRPPYSLNASQSLKVGKAVLYIVEIDNAYNIFLRKNVYSHIKNIFKGDQDDFIKFMKKYGQFLVSCKGYKKG